jgi:histone-lysine N-methyltransferase SETMAR
MENLKYRVIFEYEFHRGTSASETARRINDVYGDGAAKENIVRFWFQRFRSGNFNLQNKPRGRPETNVDNEELRTILEVDPSQSTSELAVGCGVSDKTVLIHLKQSGKVKKLEMWVPHELSEADQQTRVDCCFALLNRHNNEGILNRIITCDEKWILYDNRKRSLQWLNPAEPAKSCSKRKLTPKSYL